MNFLLSRNRNAHSLYLGFCAASALLMTLACSNNADDGSADYYLSGRVLDGSSLSSVADAELALHVGTKVRRTRSRADGSFSVGPIPPDSDYRISAELAGFDPFSFYGTHLPGLGEDDRDQALVGDVVLYQADQQTPSFTVTAASRDMRMPLDPSTAEVRFVPMRTGVDPSESRASGGPDGGAPGLSVTHTWLTNHALGDVRGFRAPLVNGAAEVPGGALRFGATYSMEVFGGPSLEPQSLAIEAARASDTEIWLSPSQDSAGSSLPDGDALYFTGRIYDGVSLERLTQFNIALEYFDQRIEGRVDADGRYFIGPLLANSDYSVVVESAGYRTFLSHNELVDPSGTSSLMSYYYDAFLYPEEVQAPPARCRVRLSDGTQLPSGFMRFAPRSGSNLFDDDAEQPVGIDSAARGRQLWFNDEDLQQRALLSEFTDGELALEAGQLVYGVNYEVTIFGVEGHEVLTTSYTAGVDGDRAWILDPLSDAGLSVAAKSNDELTLSPSGQLTIRFNQPVAFDPGLDLDALRRTLNDAFSIDSPDEDGDTERNTLVDSAALPAPISPTYRGVNLSIDGDRLMLTWDSAAGLDDPADADDPILSVNYGGLGSVLIYSAEATDPTAVSLSSLIGNSATVQVSVQ